MAETLENKIPGTDLPVIDESIDSVSKSTQHYLKRHVAHVAGIVAILLVIETLLVLLHIPFSQLYFYPLIIPFFWYLSVQSKIEKEFMQQFAEANGYTFVDRGMWDTGVLFTLGHDQKAFDVISGQYKNYPIRLYVFQYTIGYGKGSHTYLNTVFSLEFDAQMPDIFLESRTYPLGGISSSNNVVKLEGDFNKYFTLNVEPGYEVEALEVFTPDIMANLIDKASLFNMEIADNHLLLYKSGMVEEKDKLYAMYGMAQYFIEKLGPVFAQMKAGLSASASVKSELGNDTAISSAFSFTNINMKGVLFLLAGFIVGLIIVFIKSMNR